MAIDLKSFYASVECRDRGFDPLTTNLVVADATRTNKTICLAVSPSMKALGVPNRCRVFEIPSGISYVTAAPRMQRYIDVSAEIYGVYLKWFSKEDIHVYSIDEAFFDLTPYLSLYGMEPRALAEAVREDVVRQTGIPATCGMGTNLYLAKVALDILSKHDEHFFGELTEETYCSRLWNHRPLTDFWRIGPGIARRLERMGVRTMGELALSPTEPLYQTFGVDAEILIDHAWGIEPVRMEHIKAYHSKTHGISSGQVIGTNRSFEEARTLVKEMVDELALKLVATEQLASGVSVWAGYAANDAEREARNIRQGARYWTLAASDGGSRRLPVPTNSRRELTDAALAAFDACVLPTRLIHRLGVSLDGLIAEDTPGVQMSLLRDEEAVNRERRTQAAANAVTARFGPNAVLKGTSFMPGANAKERNLQIGGHRSGLEQANERRDVRAHGHAPKDGSV